MSPVADARLMLRFVSGLQDRFPGNPPVRLKLDHVVLYQVVPERVVEHPYFEDISDSGQKMPIVTTPEHAGTVDGGVVGWPGQVAE
ncbi:MAG TPA: hypothetical protein VMV06_11330 [Acidimicrobiales bacterium]|nr:hypothetical protein [Acidimicrobiales bacterium]